MNMRVTRRGWMTGAAGVLAAPALIGRAQAAPMRLRMSSSWPDDPKYAAGTVYHDTLQAALKDAGLAEKVSIQFFPNNQLGQEIDCINQVKLGVIDLMVSGSSISANLVPLVGVFDLGYLFNSFPQQTKALDAGAAKPVEDALLKNANMHIMGWAYNFGARSILSRKKVEGPADLAGMKIRSLPNPIVTECVRLMGAAATPLALGEVYTALQAGVLDGMEHDPPTILAVKFYETTKHYALTQHIFNPLVLYLSDATYRRMDPATRDAFAQAARQATAATRAHGLAVEQEAIDSLKANGVEVNEVDRDAFRKRVEPQTEAYLGQHPDARPVVEAVRGTTA
jgi:TRAP-type transport system periplasmic protein